MLTLIYAAVLVLALVASLCAIWVYLRRIAGQLGETRAALAVVQEKLAPLGAHLQPLRDEPAAAAAELRQARERLEGADERLHVLAERRGATAYTR